LEQLRRAPSLRISLEARRQSAESYALYYWLWEEPDVRDRESFLNLHLGEDKQYRLTKLIKSDDTGTQYQAVGRESNETYTVDVFPANEDTETLEESYSCNVEYAGYRFLVHRDSESKAQAEEWERSWEAHLAKGPKPTPQQAWEVVSQLVELVVEKHNQGIFCGHFSTRQVRHQGDNRFELINFNSAFYERTRDITHRNVDIHVHQAFAPMHQFSPEQNLSWAKPSSFGPPTALSDQYCLAALF
jgi:hypothetical protein